jgi:hypothetical protein
MNIDYFANTFLTDIQLKNPLDKISFILIDDIYVKHKQSDIMTLSDNLYKKENDTSVCYWYSVQGDIIIGAEFTKTIYGLIVNNIAKLFNTYQPYIPDLYSSTLYDAILNDRKNIDSCLNNIIMDNHKFADEEYEMWHKLLKFGHKFHIYHIDHPGAINLEIVKLHELKYYFDNNDKNYTKYRYILSESGNNYIETKLLFDKRRIKELTPGIL